MTWYVFATNHFNVREIWAPQCEPLEILLTPMLHIHHSSEVRATNLCTHDNELTHNYNQGRSQANQKQRKKNLSQAWKDWNSLQQTLQQKDSQLKANTPGNKYFSAKEKESDKLYIFISEIIN